MSRLSTGLLGLLAVSLVSGAAQLALGQDLDAFTVARRDPTMGSASGRDQLAHSAGNLSVNRAAKADRATGSSGPATRTKTVSLRLNGFSDTSFLFRVPIFDGSATSKSGAAKPGARNPMVACEPVVSILTEIAGQLGPGRCVT
jgi:hypothetical protein